MILTFNIPSIYIIYKHCWKEAVHVVGYFISLGLLFTLALEDIDE